LAAVLPAVRRADAVFGAATVFGAVLSAVFGAGLTTAAFGAALTEARTGAAAVFGAVLSAAFAGAAAGTEAAAFGLLSVTASCHAFGLGASAER
jgi:hypothetical protein